MRKRQTAKEIARSKRDGPNGPVLLIPHCVLNSAAYIRLHCRSKSLLTDMAMQYNVSNNGSLLASWRYMKEKRGWTSADALNKAKKELINHGLIVQTVQGRLPNWASKYACTWWNLDFNSEFEISKKNWPRSVYLTWQPDGSEVKSKRKPPPPETRKKYYEDVKKRRNGGCSKID